ncbi:Transthyretin-like family protein [Necator americanus]|uniref:Transthyretin-like family protein n=1 Tax=Necator americanus TaxID=51031 RepID=W2SHG1_NECAM|nr:Transthyretin-like family protein [Necator americanus]ETN68286.1 Transthyretin-like family protein [Necator americanus]
MKSLLIILFIFVTVVSSAPQKQPGRQNYRVRGTLLCGKTPAKDVKVKLVDDDFGPDPDDELDSGYTDANGFFELAGFTTERTTIDPHLKFYHDCNDGITPCQRRWKFELPSHYITRERGETFPTALGVLTPKNCKIRVKLKAEKCDNLHTKGSEDLQIPYIAIYHTDKENRIKSAGLFVSSPLSGRNLLCAVSCSGFDSVKLARVKGVTRYKLDGNFNSGTVSVKSPFNHNSKGKFSGPQLQDDPNGVYQIVLSVQAKTQTKDSVLAYYATTLFDTSKGLQESNEDFDPKQYHEGPFLIGEVSVTVNGRKVINRKSKLDRCDNVFAWIPQTGIYLLRDDVWMTMYYIPHYWPQVLS